MEKYIEKQMLETEMTAVEIDIANLLGWLECELAKGREVDWGMVGQMHATRAWLITALYVMSGIDIQTIKESLDWAKQK